MKATLFAVVLSGLVVSLPLPSYAQEVSKSPVPAVVQPVKKINLNKADVLELTGSFKGIGKKRAEAIVSFREAHDGFKSVADLSQVRGLGQSFVNNHLAELETTFSID